VVEMKKMSINIRKRMNGKKDTTLVANNRDREVFKIRVQEGLVGNKENRMDASARDLKKREYKNPDSKVIKRGHTRVYAEAECSFPATYTDTLGVTQSATECQRGSFQMGDKSVTVKSSWCPTKVDSEGRMSEWGYCVDSALVIRDTNTKTIEDVRGRIAELVTKHSTKDAKKRKELVLGYLQTYAVNSDVYSKLITDSGIKELIRNKDSFPDVANYTLGDIIDVSGRSYKLINDIYLGKYRWELVQKEEMEVETVVEPQETYSDGKFQQI
jgi:hypothetical protein